MLQMVIFFKQCGFGVCLFGCSLANTVLADSLVLAVYKLSDIWNDLNWNIAFKRNKNNFQLCWKNPELVSFPYIKEVSQFGINFRVRSRWWCTGDSRSVMHICSAILIFVIFLVLFILYKTKKHVYCTCDCIFSQFQFHFLSKKQIVLACYLSQLQVIREEVIL